MGDDLAEDWWEETPLTAGSEADGSTSPVAGDGEHASPKKRKRGPGYVFDGATGEWVKASSAVEAAAREAKKAKRKQERQKVSKAFAAKQEEILRQVAEGEGWKLINNLLSKDDADGPPALEEGHFITADPSAQGMGEVIATAFPGGAAALRTPPPKPGSPHVVVVAQGATRAVDLLRTLGTFGVGKTAKLFGKHKQLGDQETFLKAAQLSCAVGTPARLCKLVESGALRLTRSTLLVIEAGWKNPKQRTLLEMKDECRDLVKLLEIGAVTACRTAHLKILLV